MNRAEHYAARSHNRALHREVRRFSMTECECLQRLRPLPSPPRSPVGQLLVDQAARRQTKLYWAGYRKRQAARDALPPIPSRIPQIPGWERSEGTFA